MTCSHSALIASSESPAKRKTKTKAQRKWGDEPPTEVDMASLDFSSEKSDSGNAQPGPHDLRVLIDQSSLGRRTVDGLYEVKDWEFSKRQEVNDMINSALRPTVDKEVAPPESSGVLGSLFARLTGSKVLTPQDLKPVLEGMKQHLMKKNVAKEISDKVCEGVGESLVGKKIGGFQSVYPSTGVLVNILTVLCSHECSRPAGIVYLPHSHSDTKDLHRSAIVYQDKTLFTASFHTTTYAL